MIKVLHLGNTNNIGYEIASALRELGIEATLLVDRTDFLTSDPSWEEEFINQKIWIQYYRNQARHGFRWRGLRIRCPYVHRLQQLLDILSIAPKYDILQAYNYDVILCLSQLQKPYIAFCIGGDLNVTAFENNIVGFLLRQAYRRARYVFYSNVNMVRTVRRLKLTNAVFMPLPINTEKYVPSNQSNLRKYLGSEVILFSPTRHDWETKGNEKLLQAFAKLIRQLHYSVKLVLCSWGRDLERSRALCADLGLEDYIVWRPLMPKKELLKFYQAADIVIDQFNVGAFGLVTLEALSCGKPVIVNYDLDSTRVCYPEMPPLCHAVDSKNIFCALKELLEDRQKREELGHKGRAWVLKYHSRLQVARNHLKFYQAVLTKQG